MRITITGTILFIVVIGLSFYLMWIIYAPVNFQKQEKERREVVIDKLSYIRDVQLGYKRITGRFADDFNKLGYIIKTDSFIMINVIGDPDDTTQVVIRDTSMVSALDSLVNPKYHIDSLKYIPYGGGDEFELLADQIVKRKVPIQVLQVTAYYESIFRDIDKKLYDKKKYLRLGKMTEASYAGNWE